MSAKVSDAVEECLLYVVAAAAALPVIYFVSLNVRWIGKRGYASFALATAAAAGQLVWTSVRAKKGSKWSPWLTSLFIRLATIAVFVVFNALLYHKMRLWR